MKKLFLISFLILSISSYGNDNYQPGYILKLNNDTLHCLINLVDWDYSPRSISFKESMSENSKQYSVLDIKGADAKYYEAAETMPALAADPVVKYMNKNQLEKTIRDTRNNMNTAAKNLDFLIAAQFRDELLALEALLKDKL